MIFGKEMLGGFDILMSQKGQVKKIPSFLGCAKLVCFPEMVQGCLGMSVSVCWCPFTPDAAFSL